MSKQLFIWTTLCVLASCGDQAITTTTDASRSPRSVDAGLSAGPDRGAPAGPDAAGPGTEPIGALEITDFSAATPNVAHGQPLQLHVSARGVAPLSYAFQVISGDGTITGAGPDATFRAGSTPGNVALGVSVTDGRARKITAALVIAIVNARPTIASFDAAAPVGKTAQLTAVAADPDGDPLTYAYELIGCSGDLAGTGPQVAATLTSPATCQVQVTVRDDLGLSATASTSVTVPNTAPSITRFAPSSASTPREGKVGLIVAADDADGQTLSYRYTVLAGSGTVGDEDGTPTLKAGAALGPVRVKVTAEDPLGARAEAELTVEVVNRAPIITELVATPARVVRGSDAAITLSATDPDGSLDAVESSLVVTAGAGSLTRSEQGFTFHAGRDDKFATLEATVSDGNGGLVKASLTIELINAAPIISGVSVAPQPVYENRPSTLSVTATDPEGTTPLEYAYELDPTSTAGGSLDLANGTWQRSASVVYTPRTAGEARVSVRVRDAEGAVSDSHLQTLTVKAAAPAIAITDCDTTCAEIDPVTGGFDFGPVPLDRAFPAAALRVFNTGTVPLVLLRASLAGGDTQDFALPDRWLLSITIAPGESARVPLTARPLQPGLRRATLTLESNDPDHRNIGLVVSATGREPTTLYVAQTGDDASGTGSASAPLATIGAALFKATAGDRILVAEGRYQLSFPGLVIDKRVELLGGYESRGWTRDAAAQVTVLEEVSDKDAQDDPGHAAVRLPERSFNPRATVSFVGAKLGAETVLDGFTIVGNTRGAAYVAAVSIASAGPTLSHNVIQAGAAAGVSTGTVDGYPLHALYGTNSSAQVIGNTIDGGTSSGEGGSCAIEFRDAQTEVLLRGNTIRGGTSATTDTAIEIGLRARARIEGNSITTGSAPELVRGLAGSFAGALSIRNNVVWGAPQSTIPGGVLLVHLVESSASVLANTLVQSAPAAHQTLAFLIQGRAPNDSRGMAVQVLNNLIHLQGSPALVSALLPDTQQPTLTASGNYCFAGGGRDTELCGGSRNIMALGAGQEGFARPEVGDFHLTSASPVALRAGGFDLRGYGLSNDRDGVPRTTTFNRASGRPNNGGEGLSIGAFEQDQ